MPRPSLVCVCLVFWANARTREPLYVELQKPRFPASVLPTEDPAETVLSSSNTNANTNLKLNTNTNANTNTNPNTNAWKRESHNVKLQNPPLLYWQKCVLSDTLDH